MASSHGVLVFMDLAFNSHLEKATLQSKSEALAGDIDKIDQRIIVVITNLHLLKGALQIITFFLIYVDKSGSLACIEFYE